MTRAAHTRFVVANGLVAGAAVISVAVGTAMLLAVRDDLPDPLVLHWDDGRPDLHIGLDALLLLTGLLTLSVTAVILVAGRLAARSWRHTWSIGALVTAVGVPSCLYGVAWAQRHGPVEYPPPLAAFNGLVWASLLANVLRVWLRPRRPKAGRPSDHALESPLRVAWVGRARMPWPARIASSAGVLALILVLAWWTDAWAIFLVMGGVVAVLVAAMHRDREVAVDYSGVGFRGGGMTVPSAIKMADVRGVSLRRVKVLRDFAGWGHRFAADGTEGWITRSGEALVVHRHEQPDFVFTVDDAPGAAAVLDRFLAQSSAQSPVA